MDVYEALPVSYADGFLGQRFFAHINNRLHTKEYTPLRKPFQQCAKLVGDERVFTKFYAEFGAKLLEAQADGYNLTKDPVVLEHMRDMLRVILAAQEDTGYFDGTGHPEDGKFRGWHLWNSKYILLALLAVWRATGNASVLECACKGADVLAHAFLENEDISQTPWEGYTGYSILEAYCRLYAITGRNLYLKFAEHIVEKLEEKHRLVEKLLNHTPVYDLPPAKAYEMTSTVEGILEFYRVTGIAKYLDAVCGYWKSVQETQITPAGSGSQFELWQKKPDVSYQIGTKKRAMENCVTNYWLRLCENLFRLTGEPLYADAMEKTIYNQLLAQQSPDGMRMSYYQAMNGTKRYDMDCPYPYEWAHCCHGSAMRTFSRLPLFAAYRRTDGIAVVLYDNFSFPYGDGEISVETAFPASGEVRIHLNFSGAIRLYLRVPGWSEGGGTLAFRNEARHAPAGSFLCFSHDAERGETAVLKLNMAPRAVQGKGESEDRTLFLYGPLVLAQEGAASVCKIPVQREDAIKIEPRGTHNGRWHFELTKERRMLVDYANAGSQGEIFEAWIPTTIQEEW